jgi:hypothetical protein
VSIFEELESLNVSEECFNDIMGIVEEIINEVSIGYLARKAKKSINRRKKENAKAESLFKKAEEQCKKNLFSDRDTKKSADDKWYAAFDARKRADDRLEHSKRFAKFLPKNSKVSANNYLKNPKDDSIDNFI